jgi:hypothetical protein
MQYFCDCPARCKQLKKVGKTCFFEHERYRDQSSTEAYLIHPDGRREPYRLQRRTTKRAGYRPHDRAAKRYREPMQMPVRNSIQYKTLFNKQ